jgi:hypothetical protein
MSCVLLFPRKLILLQKDRQEVQNGHNGYNRHNGHNDLNGHPQLGGRLLMCRSECVCVSVAPSARSTPSDVSFRVYLCFRGTGSQTPVHLCDHANNVHYVHYAYYAHCAHYANYVYYVHYA